MPVHGEWRHLKANAELAVQTGVEEDRVLIAEDGVVVDLIDGRASITGRVVADYVFVDGMTVGGASEAAMEDRRRLAEDGTITILGILNAKTGLLSEPVEFLARGFVHDDEWVRGATKVIDEAMKVANRVKTVNGAELEDLFTSSVSRWMQRKYRRSPLITSVVVDA